VPSSVSMETSRQPQSPGGFEMSHSSTAASASSPSLATGSSCAPACGAPAAQEAVQAIRRIAGRANMIR